MLRYFIKKICILIFSLFTVMTITFFLIKAIPGDPFIQEQVIPEEILKSLYTHYGLDQPIYVQYLKYIKGFLTGNLGPSLIYQGRYVEDIIKDGFLVSMTLGLEALCICVTMGITLGTIAAFFRTKWQDTTAMIMALLGISVPSFLLATLLQYVFSIKLNIFPVARWGTFFHTVLPALSLAALPTAFIARLMRSNLLEVLQQDYIKTAYAKGLTHFQVIIKHGIKNALLPIVGYLGPVTAHILTGSFVIEKIFGIPGIGQWLVMSIANRDYTVIMGLAVFFSAILIVVIFLVDILYSVLDPRIQIKKNYE